MFSHWLPSHTVIQIAFDVLLLVALVLGAAWMSYAELPAVWMAAPYAITFAVVAVALNKALGFYHLRVKRSTARLAALALASGFLAAPVAYALFEEVPQRHLGYPGLAVYAFAAFLGILAIRLSASALGFRPVLQRRVMVVGTGADAQALEHSLQRADTTVVGFYPVDDSKPQVAASRVLAKGASLAQVALGLKVNEIVVAVSERRGGGMPVNALLDCKLAGVRVLDLSSYFERALGQLRLDSLRASWLVFGDGFRQGWTRTFNKRVFDVVVSAVLLVLALPVMLVTALLILAESRGPIFYSQERVGRGGRLLRVAKFRSMRPDAESDGKPRWAQTNDERVTRVGRFIRKYRIDELPQLLNVLKGDMSLVGPRPERPYFVDKLTKDIPFYAARHSVKPGLTGWAQVRYHYGASPDDAVNKLQFDLYYIKNHTLFLDLVVLFETVMVVITGKGAQ
ncbi:MAG TPA: TIGR03013 family XrtA/PEP-CTERM system glycosyltransferase [Burkholderiales bacterium]|nr:TIGR03013 family XrtA/PEP-CTERM system glycosyltransferase [Burkholderiales bacterium]